MWYLPWIWHQGWWSLQSSLIAVWSLPRKGRILCRKWCMWKRVWVFQIMIACSSVSGFQHFEGSYCLYLEGHSIQEEYPFEWMWCVPLKYKELNFKIVWPCIDRFLVNKTNRRTDFQFYWYCNSTCFGQPFCPSSGVLSHTSALVQFMQFGDRVLGLIQLLRYWPINTLATEYFQFHPAPGSTRSRNCINCTNADVRLRTPDDGQKDCPEHVELQYQ